MKLTISMRSWLKAHIAMVFVIWSAWLSVEYLALGSFSYLRLNDNADQFLPAKINQGQALAHGDFSYWNPFWFSGSDNLAAGLSNTLDSVLFAVVPGWLAYGLFMWFQRFAAGYFSYKLLNSSLRLGTLPSLYGGLAYSLFAQAHINAGWAGFTLYDQLATPGIPLVLLALTRINSSTTYRRSFGAIILGFVLSQTSHYSFGLFVILAAALWLLFVTPVSKPRLVATTALVIGAWLIGSSVTLWSNFLNAPFSHRANPIQANSLFTELSHQVSLRGGLFLDNLLSVILILIGFFVYRKADRRLLSLFAVSMACFLLLVGYPLLLLPLRAYSGFLSRFPFYRLEIVVPFFLISSGAVGAHLVSPEWKVVGIYAGSSKGFSISLQKILLLTSVTFLVLQSLNIKYRALRELADGHNFVTFYVNSDLKSLAKSSQSQAPFRVATVTYGWGQGHWLQPANQWAYGFETADGYVSMYPRRYKEYWNRVIAPLAKTSPNQFGMFNAWGGQAYLYFPPSRSLMKDPVLLKDYYDLTFLSLANVRYIISSFPIQDANLDLLPSQGRQRQISWEGSATKILLWGILTGRYPGRAVYIYENRKVLPRFFLAGLARIFDNSSQVLTSIGEAGAEDLRSTAYLNREDVRGLSITSLDGTHGETSIMSYTADRISLITQSSGSQMLVTSTSYSPYWKAWVDETESRVLPVDHAFLGVYVAAGHHLIRLEYDPPYAIRALPLIALLARVLGHTVR
jgi:hypothetical protein